jgi:hypothetical protein
LAAGGTRHIGFVGAGILLWCRHKLGDDMDRLAEERRRGLPRGRLRGKMMLYYDIVKYPRDT